MKRSWRDRQVDYENPYMTSAALWIITVFAFLVFGALLLLRVA